MRLLVSTIITYLANIYALLIIGALFYVPLSSASPNAPHRMLIPLSMPELNFAPPPTTSPRHYTTQGGQSSRGTLPRTLGTPLPLAPLAPHHLPPLASPLLEEPQQPALLLPEELNQSRESLRRLTSKALGQYLLKIFAIENAHIPKEAILWDLVDAGLLNNLRNEIDLALEIEIPLETLIYVLKKCRVFGKKFPYFLTRVLQKDINAKYTDTEWRLSDNILNPEETALIFIALSEMGGSYTKDSKTWLKDFHAINNVEIWSYFTAESLIKIIKPLILNIPLELLRYINQISDKNSLSKIPLYLRNEIQRLVIGLLQHNIIPNDALIHYLEVNGIPYSIPRSFSIDFNSILENQEKKVPYLIAVILKEIYQLPDHIEELLEDNLKAIRIFPVLLEHEKRNTNNILKAIAKITDTRAFQYLSEEEIINITKKLEENNFSDTNVLPLLGKIITMSTSIDSSYQNTTNPLQQEIINAIKKILLPISLDNTSFYITNEVIFKFINKNENTHFFEGNFHTSFLKVLIIRLILTNSIPNNSILEILREKNILFNIIGDRLNVDDIIKVISIIKNKNITGYTIDKTIENLSEYISKTKELSGYEFFRFIVFIINSKQNHYPFYNDSIEIEKIYNNIKSIITEDDVNNIRNIIKNIKTKNNSFEKERYFYIILLSTLITGDLEEINEYLRKNKTALFHEYNYQNPTVFELLDFENIMIFLQKTELLNNLNERCINAIDKKLSKILEEKKYSQEKIEKHNLFFCLFKNSFQIPNNKFGSSCDYIEFTQMWLMLLNANLSSNESDSELNSNMITSLQNFFSNYCSKTKGNYTYIFIHKIFSSLNEYLKNANGKGPADTAADTAADKIIHNIFAIIRKIIKETIMLSQQNKIFYLEEFSFNLETLALQLLEKCPICLDPLNPQQYLMTHSGCEIHEFHETCLLTWFQTEITCPICRNDLKRK